MYNSAFAKVLELLCQSLEYFLSIAPFYFALQITTSSLALISYLYDINHQDHHSLLELLPTLFFQKMPPVTKLGNQEEKYFLFVFFISSSQLYAYFLQSEHKCFLYFLSSFYATCRRRASHVICYTVDKSRDFNYKIQ